MALFTDLAFYVFPARTSARAYKIRRKVYQTHGALVLETLDATTPRQATHIVVDSNWLAQPARLQGSGLAHLEEWASQHGNVPIVHDMWALECVAQNKVLDVTPFLVGTEPTDSETESEDDKNNSPNQHVQRDLAGEEMKKEPSARSCSPPLEAEHPKPSPMNESSNAAVLQGLERLKQHYDTLGDRWRAVGYARAIAAISREPAPVCTFEQAQALPGVGTSLARKIVELAAGRTVDPPSVSALDAAAATKANKERAQLAKIHGVGPATARKWHAAGIHTPADVRARLWDTLTPAQRIGLAHLADFEARIPRAEAAQHWAIVRDAVHAVDPHAEALCMGSFRRGCATCGDVDIVVTRAGASAQELRHVVARVLVNLFQSGYLVASLSGPVPGVDVPGEYDFGDNEGGSCSSSTDQSDESDADDEEDAEGVSEFVDEYSAAAVASDPASMPPAKRLKLSPSRIADTSPPGTRAATPSPISRGAMSPRQPHGPQQTSPASSRFSKPNLGATRYPNHRQKYRLPRLWMAAGKLPKGSPGLEPGSVPRWRRIDIIIVPWAERGAAMLHYTGSELFNRNLRIVAMQHGYHLSNKGLYRAVIPHGTKRSGINVRSCVPEQLVEATDEYKIFEILGLPYRPPNERSK